MAHGRDANAKPTHISAGATKGTPFAAQLEALNDVAGRRYNVNFETLARSSNNNAAARKIPYILGVLIKKEYSDPQEPFTRKIKGRNVTDVKWKINEDLIARLSDDSWQLLTFANLGQTVYPNTSPREIARTLRQETLIARFYLKNIHP